MFNNIIAEITRGKVFPCTFLFSYSIIAPLTFIGKYSWAIAIFWPMTFMLGSIVILHGIVTFLDARHSPNWPRAKAELTQCDIKYSVTEHVYQPRVRYEFYVKGKKYLGSNLDFSDIEGSEAMATEKINRVKNIANDLYVYYKPTDPTISVIEPGLRFMHYVRFLFGIALVIVAVLGLIKVINLGNL